MVVDDVQVPLVLPAWLEPFDRDLERTVDRLRGRSLTRLDRPLTPGVPGVPTAAQATRDLAQRLADDAARLEGHPSYPVPPVDIHVLPDLLAVVGHDLALALSRFDDPDSKVADAVGSTPRERAARVVGALVGLRHAL